MNSQPSNYSNKKPILGRVAKPFNSSNNLQDKPSKIAGNNIIYNNLNTNKLNIGMSNKTSEDNMFNYEDKNLNKFLVGNANDLKDEINALKKKLTEKDKVIQIKDKTINELTDKNKKLQAENSLLKTKVNVMSSSQRRNRENIREHSRENNIANNFSNDNHNDIPKEKETNEEMDLALALEKINEMERRQQHINPYSQRDAGLNNRINNPFGINFQADDIVDAGLFSNFSNDPFFSQVISNLRPNAEEIDPLREYEDQMINDLCPNPDNMTYEQLLELQEQVGHVDKGFTKNQIERIPSVRYSKNLYRNADKCTVCQFEFKDSEVLKNLTCGHLYHKQCVDEWLLKDKKCPVCKMEVSLK